MLNSPCSANSASKKKKKNCMLCFGILLNLLFLSVGEESLWARKSGLLLFFSPAPFPQAFLLLRSTDNVGNKKAMGREEAGSEPVSQRSERKGLSVRTRRLNFSWASWTGWPPIYISFLGQSGVLYSSVWPCIKIKMLCKNKV